LEKDPAADRAFVKLAQKFVILHFDTSNGRAPHVDWPDGTEIDRIEKPVELKPMVTLMKKALKEKRPLDENPTRL
jgi:hypothetical protein